MSARGRSDRDQLEGRNPVVEGLVRGRRSLRRIFLDEGAKSDPRIDRILALAAERGVKVERVPRHKLDQLSEGRVHNGVVAWADPLPSFTTPGLLDALFDAQKVPFLLLTDGLQYEHNLGAVLRSALGFGVDGVVVPTRRGADALSPVVQRVSMGACEVVPLVRESLFVAISASRKAGIPIVGTAADGVPLHQARLSGALALVMGEEGEGMSPTLRNKCDFVVSIPLSGALESLNVSVAAAVLMYEKRRQDGWYTSPARGDGAT